MVFFKTITSVCICSDCKMCTLFAWLLSGIDHKLFSCLLLDRFTSFDLQSDDAYDGHHGGLLHVAWTQLLST